MRIVNVMKGYNLRRDDAVVDQLTSSKRRFIETWRQNVSVFMENGNICKVTIGQVTPEPTGDTTKWVNAENIKSSMTDLSCKPEPTSPSLPAVRNSCSHVTDDSSRPFTKARTEKSRDKNSNTTTTLPPSPNGFAIQNGVDVPQQTYKRKTSTKTSANTTTTPSEIPDLTDTKEITRKSSKLAREIYEKYNMKSLAHNSMPTPGKTMSNGMEQYSMPWRNKTFLSLPLRFNGNIQQRHNRLTRQKTLVAEMKYELNEAEDDLNFTKDWENVRHW